MKSLVWLSRTTYNTHIAGEWSMHVRTYIFTLRCPVCVGFYIPVFYDTQGDQALARVPLWPTSAPCLGCSWSQQRHSYSSTFQRRLAQRLSCWVGCVGHVDMHLFVCHSQPLSFSLSVCECAKRIRMLKSQ